MVVDCSLERMLIVSLPPASGAGGVVQEGTPPSLFTASLKPKKRITGTLLEIPNKKKKHRHVFCHVILFCLQRCRRLNSRAFQSLMRIG